MNHSGRAGKPRSLKKKQALSVRGKPPTPSANKNRLKTCSSAVTQTPKFFSQASANFLALAMPASSWKGKHLDPGPEPFGKPVRANTWLTLRSI